MQQAELAEIPKKGCGAPVPTNHPSMRSALCTVPISVTPGVSHPQPPPRAPTPSLPRARSWAEAGLLFLPVLYLTR